jgi:hypothetical protein
VKVRSDLFRGLALFAMTCALAWAAGAPGNPPGGKEFPSGPLEPVAAIRPRPEWNRFIILVWQWQNDVRRDISLYDLAGLHGFHIDRGEGEDDLVNLSLNRRFPYYVDHAAGKGILYLSSNLRPQVTGKRTLLVRPNSLSDPKSIATLKDHLRANVDVTKRGLALAYAFDDEISLGSFNTPAEVDIHPSSLAWYRAWLAVRYRTVNALNSAWGTSYDSFDAIQPVSFENIRRESSAPPLSGWNLSRWIEWRHFMDYQFAQVLADLTRFTNKLDPSTPAGFVGGQQPSAYGGYDYALLARSVQWMEGDEDLLRSFWNSPRRPHVQTYNLTGSIPRDTWTLWHRLAHGEQATIAWPEGWFVDNTKTGKRELSSEVQALSPVFREIQGQAGEFIVQPDSHLEADPVGLYYSHASIRAGWAMDAIPHGITWPLRSSSMDDENLSSGWLRHSWGRLLEDLGYQYDFISYLDVQEARIDLARKYKVIILPQTLCLSDREAGALRDFVAAGGTLIADSLCGVFSETGRGRQAGALDALFGLVRDEAKGYLDGGTLAEIDAERYKQPFPNRLRAYDGSLKRGSLVVFERGTRSLNPAIGETVGEAQVLIRNRSGSGQSVYLNLAPTAYDYFPFRSGATGREWRDLVGRLLQEAALHPRIGIDRGSEPWIETLLWRNGDRYCLAILKNVSRDPDDHAGEVLGGPMRQIRIQLDMPASDIINLRTGRKFGNAASFTDDFFPNQASLYSFRMATTGKDPHSAR